MRAILAVSLALLVSACATAPKPGQPVAEAPQPSEHTRGEIIGLTAPQLVSRLGNPALQIREGESLKLQFRSDECVLDAYLYASGTSPLRVTYVDARTKSLGAIDQALCIRSIEAP